MKATVLLYARAIRTNQWLKNTVVFAAVVFSGQLFNPELLWASIATFIIFCLLSSASYLVNDVIDMKHDAMHPVKKHRPIASGQIKPKTAITLATIFYVIGLVWGLTISPAFFFLVVTFIALNILYSTILKQYPVIDIFTISFSFMIRAFAGEVATGYHIPIWLLLTIFFMSLYIATIKRNAELMRLGDNARDSLAKYNQRFLDFLTYTFATASIIVYAQYTYLDVTSHLSTSISYFVSGFLPTFEGRKLMMLTIPLVVYVIARYGQLFYTRVEGERPEKVVISDAPLITAMAIWAILVVSFIYVL